MTHTVPTETRAARLLRAGFDRGSRRYDLLVSLNPGYHRHLRSAAEELAGRAAAGGTPRLIDLGCGSGASTRALLAAVPPGTRIAGLDMSEGMLRRARVKPWPASVTFDLAKAGDLDTTSWGPGEWDGVFAAYLFRNVPASDRDKAVCEAFELLRPGGWLVAQEYSVAGRRRAEVIWEAVCRLIITPLAVLVDGNPGLYRYLRRSVRDFDSLDRFSRRLAEAGFDNIRRRTVPGWQRGILHVFIARKPAAR